MKMRTQVATAEPEPTTGAGAATSTTTAPPQPVRRRIRLDTERYGVVYALVFSVVLFSLLKSATFPTLLNLKTLLISQSILALLSIGLMIPAAAGHFDLSVGYLAGFVGMEVAWLSVKAGWPPLLAVIAGLLTGAATGAVNGFLVVVLQMSSFIATLGMGILVSGLTLGVSGGAVVFGVPHSIIEIGQGRFADIEMPVYIMIVVAIVVACFMRWRPFGRYLYAVGGNENAARLAGINASRLIFISLICSGALAGLAGLLFMANAGVADPSSGPDLLLSAFAAVFLGSTTIVPGRFNVPGTLAALFFLAVLVDGLQQLGAPSWVAPVFNGVALIGAVAISVRKRRSS